MHRRVPFPHPTSHLIDRLPSTHPFPSREASITLPIYKLSNIPCTLLSPPTFSVLTMAPSTFPPELLDSICSHLPTPDLLSVASANYTLNAVAQRTLYRNISITPTANNLSVLNTLAARPQVATHVRSFSIAVHNEQPHTFYTLLAKALEQMTELTSLTLFLDPDASWVLGLNSEARYLNLTSFASSFPFDSHLVDFLSRTPSVIDLQVGSALPSNDQSEINLPPTSIPNLARFTGPHNTARLVVPQRPIEALFLSQVVSDDSIFAQLSLSKTNITIFDAVVSLGLLPCVTAISQAMPSLHYLRLMTVAPLDENFDSVRPRNLEFAFKEPHTFLIPFSLFTNNFLTPSDPCRPSLLSSIPE